MTDLKRPDVLAKEARQRAFLAALAEKGTLKAACAAAQIDRSLPHLWRKDPDFAPRYLAAMEEFADSLEEEALRRGRDGYDEPLTYQGAFSYLYRDVRDDEGNLVLDVNGQPIQEMVRDSNGEPVKASVRKYSDALLARQLEARVKGYARKTEVSGPDGEPLGALGSPLDAARKIAFALALGLRQASSPALAAPPDNGEDLC